MKEMVRMARNTKQVLAFVFSITSISVLSSCGKPEAAPPPQTVSVVKMSSQAVTLTDDLSARVTAYYTAEIRPQVSGIILKRLFVQGSDVRQGQVLFQIDPASFIATAKSSAAALQRAIATQKQAAYDAERQKHLFEANATSRQSYESAVTTLDQAKADVAQARATLQLNELNVAYTKVTSPISGRIDETSVTEGALVTASQSDALATVQQIDQVYVDVRQPSSQLAALKSAQASGKMRDDAIQIIASDGHVVSSKGHVLFSGISVDETTGEVIVRILVPNADHALLPGMFVRARLPRAYLKNGLSVPQQAVQHDSTGNTSVMVVDKKGSVAVRPVVVSDVINGRYLVDKGLSAGDVVIVEGMDRVQPGMPVKTAPWQHG